MTKIICRICGNENRRPKVFAGHRFRYLECECCSSVTLLDEVRKREDNIDGNVFYDSAAFRVSAVLDCCREHHMDIHSWAVLENDRKLVDYLHQNTDFSVGQEMDLLLSSEMDEMRLDGYDVLSCFRVMDEVEKPEEFIQSLYRKMKRNAILVLGAYLYPSFDFLLSYADDTISSIRNWFASDILTEQIGRYFEILEKWEYGHAAHSLIDKLCGNHSLRESLAYNRLSERERTVQHFMDENLFADRIMIIAKRI